MSEIFLEMKNIVKTYGGIKALDNVNLELRKGEVLCLLGENGAGKSTLMKILSGVEQPTSGEIFLDGQKIALRTPRLAHEMGFSTVYQEMVQLSAMTIAENIFIGRYPTSKGLVNFERLRAMTVELMDRINIRFDPDAMISSLSIAQRQLVEILKALSFNSRVVILDEPTSSLANEESDILFGIVRKLKERGVSIIYISHRLDDIFKIGDRAVVLRDGRNSGGDLVSSLTADRIISMMVGRSLDRQFPKRETNISDEVILRVAHIKNERVRDVSFSLRKAEVLGFGGLVGAGRSELMRAILGIDGSTGEVEIEGRIVKNENPAQAIANGFAAVPEDRKEQGMIPKLPVIYNIELSSFKKFTNALGFFISRLERKIAGEYFDKLSIKARDLHQICSDLSGGNQQKVVLARCLVTNPKVLILDEPTRGIDVGAKAEIYEIMNDLVKQGVSIIMISSELPELLNISDRIIVMREGTVTGELSGDEMTEEGVMRLATREALAV